MKTPNSKFQTPGKLQASTFKAQAGYNGQATHSQPDEHRSVRYPIIPAGSWILNEEEDGQEPHRHPFDLEERTAKFGEAVVRFSKKIPREPTNNRLIDQLVGCGTSVGANYLEASESVSKKDFRFSISRCVKEAKEAKFFLRMVAASEIKLQEEACEIYREGHELHLIFANMFRKR